MQTIILSVLGGIAFGLFLAYWAFAAALGPLLVPRLCRMGLHFWRTAYGLDTSGTQVFSCIRCKHTERGLHEAV